jgi:hypothetical protein
VATDRPDVESHATNEPRGDTDTAPFAVPLDCVDTSDELLGSDRSIVARVRVPGEPILPTELAAEPVHHDMAINIDVGPDLAPAGCRRRPYDHSITRADRASHRRTVNRQRGRFDLDATSEE